MTHRSNTAAPAPDAPPPPPARAPSLEDVADRAGVSSATVSRALHNPEKVAPATIERVRRAVGELGYRPNAFASGLMRRSPRVLGVVFADPLNADTARVLAGAEDQARRLGYFVLLIPHARLADPAAVLDDPALALIDAAVVITPSLSAGRVLAALARELAVAAAEEHPGQSAEALGAELVRRAVARVVAREAARRTTPASAGSRPPSPRA